jgi:hypothetical protein
LASRTADQIVFQFAVVEREIDEARVDDLSVRGVAIGALLASDLLGSASGNAWVYYQQTRCSF